MTEARQRILIVDDNPDDRADIRSKLLAGRTRRYEFVELEFGAQAVQLLRAAGTTPFDCILLDFYLPDTDASELLSILLAPGAPPIAPILVLTGAETDVGPHLLARGASDFLGKAGLNAESLPRAIDTAIERARLRAAEARAQAALRENEGFLQAILALSPAIIYVFDLVSRSNRFINRPVAGVLGYSPEQIDAMGAAVAPQLMHPDDAAPFEAHLGRVAALADGETADLVFRMRAADGTWRRFHGHDRVFGRDEHGRATRLLGAAMDITERWQAERAQEESARKYRQLFESASVGMVEMDPVTGRFLAVNETFCQLLGYSAPELLARTIFDVTHPEDLAISHGAMQRREGMEKRMLQKDGSTRWVQVTRAAVLEGETEVHRLLASVQDVSQRHESERLRRNAERLETVERLAGGVAHLTNNQMMVVLATTELGLRRRDILPQTEVELLRIRGAAENASGVAAQLLAFGRIQRLKAASLSVNALVTGAVPSIEALLGADIRLELELSPDLPPVLGDGPALADALTRLVKNARAAMPNGGTLLLATDQVELPGAEPRARLPAGRVARLRVRDTGTGLEARYLDQVFEPFFTLRPGGTGLGLSMVQGVVRQFEGDIHVSSTLGEGTELAIYLKFAPS